MADLKGYIGDVRLYRAVGYGQGGRVTARVQVAAPTRTIAKEFVLQWAKQGFEEREHFRGLLWEVASTKTLNTDQPLVGVWPAYEPEHDAS